uniref:Pro-resilin-like n=1 Tax=Timema monikensis TaxID=170555 RepID=A0A7R9HK89_9NEOP|nr:unnamed protein product [Timema monikensis]
MFQYSAMLLLAAACVTSEPQSGPGNTYLPPDQTGYNYDRPTGPGLPTPTPSQPPISFQPPSNPSRPPTSYPSPPGTPSYPQPPPQQSPGFPTNVGRPSGPAPPPYGGLANALVVLSSTAEDGEIEQPQGDYQGGDHHGGDHVHMPGMPYDFNYAVKDDYYGTDYSRNEVSDGDVVRGEYRVQLPDGRLQIVRYTADWKTGFHADVSYEGEAQYPQPSQGYNYQAPAAGGPAPTYGAPTTL